MGQMLEIPQMKKKFKGKFVGKKFCRDKIPLLNRIFLKSDLDLVPDPILDPFLEYFDWPIGQKV